MLWADADRYGYEELLGRFLDLLRHASSLRTTDPSVSLPLKAAVIGFSLHYDIREWGVEEYNYVNRFVTEDPKPVDLNRVGGCEEGYAAFMCLGLGTLCGRHLAGEIDVEGVARGEWVLVAFLSNHNEEICARYSEFLQSAA